VQSNWKEVHEAFDSMGLREGLLRGIYSFGFERPSAVQKIGIKPIIDVRMGSWFHDCLQGRDTITQAQSGTGKTATFAIGLLQRLDCDLKRPQSLVLAPTRELANQHLRVIRALGDYLGVSAHLCVGGQSVRSDVRAVASAQVVVGTPGRILHLLKDGHLAHQAMQILVLDEADEILSQGFRSQIYDIFQFLPKDIQCVLTSATMPPELFEITAKFMNNPVEILIKKEQVTLDGIKQFYVNVDLEAHKLATLVDLYESLTITQAIIFCNTRRKVDWLTDQMHQRDFTVSYMHSDMAAEERALVMKEFISGASRVLVTTDLLSRGIDVQSVSLVINYDLPYQRENYIHRIGRSGRFGRKGVTINFVTREDVANMRGIEAYYNTLIMELPLNPNEVIGL
jgi:translation initiation factor 4A